MVSKKLSQTCTSLAYYEHVNKGCQVNFGAVSTEELTMEQESEGMEREEEESVCLLYNTLRTRVGW